MCVHVSEPDLLFRWVTEHFFFSSSTLVEEIMILTSHMYINVIRVVFELQFVLDCLDLY